MALFKRRIKSALYIDFENVPVNAERLGNLVAWLEDGAFEDPSSRRTFVERRVYWNSSAERHRAAFEALDFEVVLLERYSKMKNSADIRIAMDMVEASLKRRPLVEEFILISRDSDFVPVIQRLGEQDKRTIMLVEESQPVAYTAYSLHADGIITSRVLLQEGQAYQRNPRGLMEKLGLKGNAKSGKAKPAAAEKAPAGKGGDKEPATAATARPAASKTATPAAVPNAAKTPAALAIDRKQLIEQAVDVFVKVASRTPGKLTGKQTIVKQLKLLKGFSSHGAKPYLGFKTYDALAEEVSKRNQRITLQRDKTGGFTVVYVPRDDSAAPSPVASDPAGTDQQPVQPTS